MKGFSLAMSHIIFFIATIIALGIAVSAISVALKSLSYAMSEKTQVSAAQVATVLKIVDGGADTNTNLLWVYVKNIGETTLDVNSIDVFVEGRYVSSCNSGSVSCIDTGGDYSFTPGELLEVNVSMPVSPGSYKVRVVSEYGSYADYEVVVG